MKAFALGVLVVYFLVSVFVMLGGIMDASMRPNSCKDPMIRIEYIFPAHALGCWLGEAP